ncbi:MAG: hypothetical protein ABJA67_05040 [Chthonomonadales bacterium]
MKRNQMPLVALLVVAVGCRNNSLSSSPQAKVRRETSAKLRVGMTTKEVAQTLGQPTEFRRGNATRDDVAVYKVTDQTFTIYFYQDRLTRYVSSQQPVNR